MSFFHPQTILVLTGSNCSILTEENYSLLNKQEKKRAAEFLFDQDRVQYVICRTLLKQLLSLITKIPTHQISIRESLNGKPYLNKSNIFFNLSHSANNVAIAVTDLGPIGIDIENKNKTFDYLKLSNLIFSENEQEQLKNPHEPVDEYSGFCFSSAIKIFDPETQEVIVNIRGDN